jgi:NADH-quinone oxidoreductase subunit H
MAFTLTIVLKILSIVIPLLISVAYFTIAERKIMGAIQRRRGPNIIGYIGLLQPFADGLKLFTKETTLPTSTDTILFLCAPALSFILSMAAWSVVPLSDGVLVGDINLGIFYLFAVSSLNVYGILFAGWASNSKYAYLGSVRSAAQMLSYEIAIGFTILNVVICSGSYNLTNIIISQQKVWFIVPLLPIFVIFYLSMLAETNRHPFDLPEAEAELVSGYNVEYSAMTFALFFLSEYANMLLMCVFSAVLFLGGWLPIIKAPFFLIWSPVTLILSLKIIAGIIFFIVTRATLPRYRYDQLMMLGWRSFLPLTIGYFILNSAILISFNLLPNV